MRAVNVQRPASSPAPSLQTPRLRASALCGLGRELFQAHSWGVLWRLKILFPVVKSLKVLLEADAVSMQHLSEGERKILVELLRKVAHVRGLHRTPSA